MTQSGWHSGPDPASLINSSNDQAGLLELAQLLLHQFNSPGLPSGLAANRFITLIQYNFGSHNIFVRPSGTAKFSTQFERVDAERLRDSLAFGLDLEEGDGLLLCLYRSSKILVHVDGITGTTTLLGSQRVDTTFVVAKGAPS